MNIIQRRLLLAISAQLVCAGSIADAQQYKLTTLATFNGANGAFPFAGLILDADGNLYGTTAEGGTTFEGTVFELGAGTHSLSTLANFSAADGDYSVAGLLADASGNLYGTTQQGGANNAGSVFEVAAGTHVLTTPVTFDGTNGANPAATLIADANGNLYGTTLYGGGLTQNDGFGFGTVFELDAGTHTLTTLAAFNRANGSHPRAGLVADASGNLYGTTTFGGDLTPQSNEQGLGTVFELNPITHALSTIAAFNGANGAHPEASLIADADGNLYGTTTNGGAYNYGTVFELAASTHSLSTLFSFDYTNGAAPVGNLLADADGNLYGTTLEGGANKGGTIFKLAAGTRALSTLVALHYANGGHPYAGLISNSHGNLYGTTSGHQTGNGDDDYGTVFELSLVPEPSALTLGILALGSFGLILLVARSGDDGGR